MRVLVTLAGGFIGHHLVAYLKKQGYWVGGVDIKQPEYAATKAAFCFIDGCVIGMHKLMHSDSPYPLNLGSDRLISINDMVDIVDRIAGIKIVKRHIQGPQGVRGQNSDNTRLRHVLGWEPKVSLEEGLEKTYVWIEKQVAAKLKAAAGAREGRS